MMHGPIDKSLPVYGLGGCAKGLVLVLMCCRALGAGFELGFEPTAHSVSANPVSAKDVLARATSRDEAYSSGQVRVALEFANDAGAIKRTLKSFADGNLSTMILPEVRACRRIDYAWAPELCWRVALYGADASLLRELRCDGQRIDTGDKRIWDIRFFTRFQGGELGDEFDALMWPYYIVATWHMFPATYGRSPSATRESVFGALDIAPAGDEFPDCYKISFRLADGLFWGTLTRDFVFSVTVDPNRGFALVEDADMFRTSRFSEFTELASGQWLPLCSTRYVAYGGVLTEQLYTTRILLEGAEIETPSPEVFSVEQTPGCQMIEWQHDDSEASWFGMTVKMGQFAGAMIKGKIQSMLH